MAQSLTGAFERFGYRSSAAKSLHCLLRGHGHRGLYIADAEGRIMIVTDVGDAAKRPRLRHSGAMPTGPRKARPDDRLRIEPGISRFPDARLRISGLVLAHPPGMTETVTICRRPAARNTARAGDRPACSRACGRFRPAAFRFLRW